MTEKYIPYMVDGEMYDVPESKVSAFEKRYPSATIEMRVGEDIFDVPFADKDRFLKRYSDATYMYDSPNTFERKSEPKEAEDKTTVWETIGKSVAAAGVTTAKLALDLGRTAWKATIPGMLWGEDLDEVTRDMSNPITRASVKLGETAERLSREADPTGGEKGFVELLKEGKVGMAMQKALGSGLESLPMMLAASTGVGAVAYGAAMAAGNYADETRENPEIAAWKRGANAVGSAALELAVERIGGPLKNVFGKAGKELTEEAAKGILEQVARESKEEIAKRIVKGIGTLGKDGLEEGGEELLTSFGNDALGMSLDWIDGNKDYGIKAQWDQYKEQNPDADKKAFAREKAEEYFDAFLGGALSGMEISGATSAISARSKSKRQAYIDSEMKKAHELGAAMDYRDMYDVYKEVNKDIDNAAATFVNDKGEATISREFIENLTAEEAMTLSQSKDFSKEQKAALAELAWAKAGQEGLNQKIDQRVEDNINAAKARIDKATENGQVISGMVNGRVVYVSGGVAKNGSVHISEDGTDGPVLIIDSVTGEETTVNSKEITSAKSADATEVFNAIENSFRQRAAQDKETAINTMSPKAKIDSIQEYAGKKIMVDLGSGMIEVEVQEVSPKTGEVRIKGKKGDLGGQSIISLGADVIYDSLVRGDDGAPVIVDDGNPIEDEEVAEEETVAPTTEEAATEEVTETEPEIVEDEDYRDGTYTILIDGKPVPVYVTNQDDSTNTLVYEYEDENGNTKRGRTSISGFGEAIRQAVDFTPEAPVVEEPEVTVETPTTEAAPVVDEAAEAPAEIPVTPQTIDWDVLFETDPENYFAEIQNQFGEKAEKRLNAVVASTQKKLDKLNKTTPDTDNELFEIEEQKEKLEAKIEALNGMVARLTAPAETTEATSIEVTSEQTGTTTEAPAKTVAFGANVDKGDRLEIPKKPVIKRPRTIKEMSALDPMNSTELAARELGLKDGGIKLTKESFLHHTGYGTSEVNSLKGLFLSKEKGGMTVEEAGERLMEIDREYNLGLFDQDDPNAGVNAILDALSENRTMGELRSYIARRRQAEAQREADAIYNYEMEQYEKLLDEADWDEILSKELESGKALTEDEYNEFNAILAEEINDYDTGNQGEIDILHETEDIGDLPASEGGAYGGIEESNQVLQETQSVQTRGERNTEGSGVDNKVSEEDAYSSVHGGEPSVSEREYSGEVEEYTGEDMPDFTTEVTKTPVAPNPVDNPVAKAKEREGQLLKLLERDGVDENLKKDAARRAGKEVADMFATKQDYEDYEAEASDFGEFIPFFEEGVNDSFKNRQNSTGNSFHIGEMMEPNSEAKQIATEVVLQALEDAKIEVERVTNEQAQKMLDIRDQLSNIEMMTVFHGSGNKFDEFNHAHMGEGEGAQAHGWGTYVAKEEATSMYYARMGRVSYLGSMSDLDANQQEVINNIINLISVGYTFEEAINEGKKQWKKLSLNSDSRAKRSFLDSLTPDDFKMRYLYSVEIPDYDGSNYIDEQSMTREQAEKLYEACQKNGLDYSKVIEGDGLLDNRGDGRKVYSSLTKMLGSDKAASEFLSRAGFVGIKYTGRTDGDCFVIFNEADANITGRTEFYQTPDGVVYGWTDGKKIYLTEAGFNPNTPIHEYTHLWAKAMMQKNPKGWNSVKSLLKGTPIWNEVINDPNYSNIKDNEDAVASEALSRLSGSQNAAKMEQMAQQMIDDAKGTMRKAEARGLIQNIKDALNKFWNWVGKELFKIENFSSIDEVTDRVLWDLMNQTDLGELSEGQVETQIVTDPKVIAELEAAPKIQGFRNVVMNEDGSFSSPMAYWLQSTKEGAKSRIETAKFELGKWEEAEEHPELVDENGKVTLVKPNKSTVAGVAYDPYIHNRLEPVNLQFKDAWKRDDLVYVETEVSETDLESGYHADKALLPVGVHSWSNGDVMLSKYDKPVRIMPWEDVADAWAKRLNGEGVHFDVVPPAMRSLLVERGVEILPPHKGMGKDCNDAYNAWKNSISDKSSISLQYDETADTYTSNDGGRISPEAEGVQEEVSISEPLSKGRKLARPSDGEVSRNDNAQFNPISQREGESERSRNNREAQFLSVVNSLTADETITLFAFLKDYFRSPSGVLKSKADDFVNSIRKKGNDRLADFVESFINDELKYREGVSSSIVAKHGLLVGVPYSINAVEQMFYAYNNDGYNGTLFDRALAIAKRLGVAVRFATKNDNGDYISGLGVYNQNDNTITLDANLLVSGNTSELCQTIVHELIHSIVARSASIMSGRAVDKNNKFIDANSLPKDVIDGINTLKEVYDTIKDDGNFQNTYGQSSFEEMLSEITDPKFRALLKAKNVWKKFLHGICQILGIADDSYTKSDALTEIESALDKILSSAERGELDSAYASYLGELADGYTLEDLENLEDGDVKRMLTQHKLFRTGIDPNEKVQETAKEVYDRVVKANWQEFQRQFQDAMQPVRIAIDAIQQETGNTPIEDYENFLLMHNQSSSRSRVETDIFRRKHFTPIVEWINKMITDILEARGENVKNSENRSRIYSEIMQYLMAKHGLERNKYYQEHRTRKLYQSEKEKEEKAVADAYGERIRRINEDTNLSEAERELELRKAKDEHDAAIAEIKEREVPDVRDYSGLTALFGMDSKKFREAEAEAQRLVDEFESSLGEMPRELWDRINAATNKTLRHSYECGLISRRQYNEIKSMFKYYIPLRGFDETTAEDVYSYARFEGNRFSPAVAKAGGRTSLADDPLAFILSMAESEIAQGNKNRAKQALYHFILNRTITDDEGNEQQNTLMQVEDVWYVQNVDDNGNITYTIAVPDHKSGQTIQEFEEKMRELEAEGKAQKSKKGQPELGMRFQKQRNKSAHYVFLKVNGVDKAIYINGDPKAAEAINGMDKSTQSELEKKMKSINRFISSTFTNYSLEFTARNYFRDMLYSHINIGIKESDPEYRKKFRQNWRHNNLRTMMNMLKAFKEGELDWRNLTEDEAAFVEFMKNGGQTGYTMLNSVENHKRDLEKSIERMRNGVENGGVKDSAIFKHTLGAIELLNEASELVTRFAAFKTSRDLGRDMLTSINDAKEITVNFNTKGAQDGKGWMGMISRYFGWSKFFFNASVQGVQNIKSMSEANKLKFCSVVGGIVASGFMVPVLTAAISQLLGGDEDEYWNIPEYDRQNNFCLVLGKGMYVKIPLPIGFREVYAMGDMVAAMAFDKKFKRDVEQVGMDMANKIASVVLPINPLESQANGLNFWHTFLYTALPSSAQFAIQNATNIDWKGAPLQKEYTYNENDPQWMKAFASNPDWMTGLSKWCNEHIGTGDYKGWDWSPEKLDNTLSGLFGGVYSLTKKFGRSISMIWNEENRNLSNIPLSGVVLGSGIDDDDRFVTDVFYEQQDFYDDRIGYIKRRAEKFGYDLDDVFLKEKGKHHPKMQEIYGNKHFDFMQEWYKGSAELKKYNKKVKDQEKKIAAKEHPTEYDYDKLAKLMDRFATERREFVEDMLELD